MATNPVFQVLDDLGTQKFMDVVLTIVDEFFTSYTTTAVDELHQRDDRMPTAKASLDLATQATTLATTAVANKIDDVNNEIRGVRDEMYHRTHLTFQLVTGPISSVTNPKTDIIYLQHDDLADIAWVVYVRSNNEWLSVGDFTRDFSNYWSKDDDECVLDYRSRMFEVVSPNEMHNAVVNVWFNITDEEELFNTFKCKMDKWSHELIFSIPNNQNVNLVVDNNGELILISNDTLADKALENYKFSVEDNILYCTIDMDK